MFGVMVVPPVIGLLIPVFGIPIAVRSIIIIVVIAVSLFHPEFERV